MDKHIFEEIARELKALHNEAVKHIQENNLNQAKKTYETASNLSELTGYFPGVGMSMFSIANLEVIREDYIAALNYAKLSKEHYVSLEGKEEVIKFIEKISLYLVKKGIEFEKNHDIDEALIYFNHALPYLKGKRKEAVLYEIELLNKIIK